MSTTRTTDPLAAGPTVIHDYANIPDGQFDEHTDDRHCPCRPTISTVDRYTLLHHTDLYDGDES